MPMACSTEALVIDTSAIVAILFDEAEADIYFEQIRKSEPVWLSSVSKVETMMVLTSRFNDLAIPKFAGFCDMLSVRVAPIDNELADQSIAAFLRFGKGRHPAGLNFGDCFSYALAKKLDAPLLFKGNDFSRTDIICAIR